MNIKILNLVLIFILASFLTCTKEEEVEPTVKETMRTILVYMVADNTLEEDAPKNIRLMEQGFIQQGTNVIIFIDGKTTTTLLQVQKNRSKVLKVYGKLNSTDPEVMKSIIEEVQLMFPANSYGLILWSHADSWIPTQPAKRSFGEDGLNHGINISDLARILPFKFEFIIADACYMGGIEIAYELRSKANYLLAAPSSILSFGFPYDKVLPKLTNINLDLIGAGQEFYEYYNKQRGLLQFATISLINLSELDNLAKITDTLIPNNFNYRKVNLNTIQCFDEDRPSHIQASIAYDMLDFFEIAFPERDLTQLKEQINKVILYKAHTPALFDHPIYVYCGLSVYIPVPWLNYNYNLYYKQLEWYKDSGFKYMMDNLTL